MTKEFDTADYQLETIVGVSGMTVGQMITMYRQAPKKGKQLRALAEMSGMSQEQVKTLLLANGVSPMEMPRERKKADAKPEPDEQADIPTPDEFAETMFKAISAMNNMIDAYARQAAAVAEMRKKLAKIREFLEREGATDEP